MSFSTANNEFGISVCVCVCVCAMFVCAVHLVFKAFAVCLFSAASALLMDFGGVGTWQAVTPRTLSALPSPPCGASRVGGARELVVSHHLYDKVYVQKRKTNQPDKTNTQSVTPRALSSLLSPPGGASRVGGAGELVVSHHFAQTRCTTLARHCLAERFRHWHLAVRHPGKRTRSEDEAHQKSRSEPKQKVRPAAH